ncbi:MAG: hypothetical protein J3Q66DRAFT_82110 [Benniella sp.]|nr:MAG: hypothetical protein J3Q66DRAFT_82110 [Benniella sp.]
MSTAARVPPPCLIKRPFRPPFFSLFLLLLLITHHSSLTHPSQTSTPLLAICVKDKKTRYIIAFSLAHFLACLVLIDINDSPFTTPTPPLCPPLHTTTRCFSLLLVYLTRLWVGLRRWMAVHSHARLTRNSFVDPWTATLSLS